MRALHPLLLLSSVLLCAACNGDAPAPSSTVEPPATVTATVTLPAPTETPVPPTATAIPPAPTPGPTVTSSQPAPVPPTPASSSASVACGDILAPLDKQHSLTADCQPPDLVPVPESMSHLVDYPIILRRAAADAMVSLISSAADAGFALKARSAYRSYAQQQVVFNYWVGVDGYAEAVRVSAEPGHSEHQLGTAADVVSASSGYDFDYFDGTPDAAWLAENCWRFGYVLSYPAGKESVTGYAYEPWHVRYVGTDVTARVRASGLTLHEFLLQR